MSGEGGDGGGIFALQRQHEICYQSLTQGFHLHIDGAQLRIAAAGKHGIIVTDNGGRVIGGDKKIPVTVEELEAFLS